VGGEGVLKCGLGLEWGGGVRKGGMGDEGGGEGDDEVNRC
jgi:hypothetical protein